VPLTRLLLLIVLGYAVYTSGLRLADLRFEDEDVFPLLTLKPSLVNIVTLGHKELYNDLAYFWLLQTLIKEDDAVRDHDQVLHKIQLLTKHRPQIESLYMLSCFVMALDFHRPQDCEAIINDGIDALPKSWLVPAIGGYMFAFVLKDPVKASLFYSKIESIPGHPDYLTKLNKRLLKGIEKKDGEKALRSIIDGTTDDDYREFLLKFLNERK
jgi:hypothetical protein